MKISLIAAIGPNRELGKDNKLLWHISEDLKHFKKLTQGHVVIMGRKTFESMGKPLPNRINIIISKNPALKSHYNVLKRCNKSVFVFDSLKGAIEFARTKTKDEIFVIGGGQIYEQALKYADKLYLTIVEGNFRADTFFPDYSEFKKVVSQEKKESDGYKYKFVELEK